jgi:NAD(P)-dependent dehydrogenase (short-subunit alcohol dehydrogenase family)
MSGGDRPVALVTGASRGLGLEVARQLLAEGMVVLAGVREPSRADAALGARGGGDRRHPLRLDVTSDADAARCGQTISGDYGGRLDVLINNAAIHYDTGRTPLGADWRVVTEAIDTNLLGAWRMARLAAPFMRARRRGRIVNVSSAAGAWRNLGSGTPAYSLSKLALNGLTRMLATELEGSGVLVNAVCPGWVATDMGGPGGRPVEDGARGIVWAALLPDDGPTGGFFRDGRPIAW